MQVILRPKNIPHQTDNLLLIFKKDRVEIRPHEKGENFIVNNIPYRAFFTIDDSGHIIPKTFYAHRTDKIADIPPTISTLEIFVGPIRAALRVMITARLDLPCWKI